jgi:hypothetical protein
MQSFVPPTNRVCTGRPNSTGLECICAPGGLAATKSLPAAQHPIPVGAVLTGRCKAWDPAGPVLVLSSPGAIGRGPCWPGADAVFTGRCRRWVPRAPPAGWHARGAAAAPPSTGRAPAQSRVQGLLYYTHSKSMWRSSSASFDWPSACALQGLEFATPHSEPTSYGAAAAPPTGRAPAEQRHVVRSTDQKRRTPAARMRGALLRRSDADADADRL